VNADEARISVIEEEKAEGRRMCSYKSKNSSGEGNGL
jgi:hypothetical protein